MHHLELLVLFDDIGWQVVPWVDGRHCSWLGNSVFLRRQIRDGLDGTLEFQVVGLHAVIKVDFEAGLGEVG